VEDRESATGVDVDQRRGMTYEDGGGVDTSEDGERADANNIVVVQRGAGLIILDGPLKLEIPAGTQGD
jgi:hypothetical protein